ncbi:MAG: AAA family ATPase [Candidatus Omnitrophota bacterium]|nr:AAA family ATPase [Candidatus Omnitrophota bacterium]
MAHIICVANQKGGTGKTTSAVNIAAYFAKQGKRSLILDMEPQSNATLSVGLEPRNFGKTIYEVLLNECPLKEVIIKDIFKNLDIAPSNIALSNTDINLAGQPDSQFRLKESLKHIVNDYHYIFIDCPPSLSLLVMNSFAASDSVLIPLQADYLSLEGLAQLVKSVNLAKQHLNTNLRILGILFCIVDLNQRIERESIELVRQNFTDEVFTTIIKACVKLKEVASHGLSIFDYAPLSVGAFNYGEAARELEERCGKLLMAKSRETVMPQEWANPLFIKDEGNRLNANLH